MQLGISTACFYPQLTEESFRLCGQLGAQAAEIFFNSPAELDGPVFRELLAIRQEYGIRVTSLHPCGSVAEPYTYFSAYVRRCTDGLDDFARNAYAAARLGAGLIVLHGGKPTGLEDDAYIERFVWLRDRCRAEGVELAHENVVNFRLESPAFVRTMRRVLGDDVAFVLDLKQAVRAGIDPWQMLDAMGPCLRHLHLNDHDGGHTCLLPGRGGFDFAALFAALRARGYAGAGVVEVYRQDYTDPAEVVASLRWLEEQEA